MKKFYKAVFLSIYCVKNKIFTFCLILLCLPMTACSLFEDEPDRIRYEVTGTALSARVTMNNADMGIEQFDIHVPWFEEFHPHFKSSDKVDKFGNGMYYYDAFISARNNGDSGSITVKLYRKGHLIKKATSNGAYVVATVSNKFEF